MTRQRLADSVRTKWSLSVFVGLCALLLLVAFAPQAHAVAVDLELVLLADVSGSLDAVDFALQRDGYVAAFQDAGLQTGIQSGAIGSIAATLVYWSGDAEQVQAVGWTHIFDAASANAFAAAIGVTARPFTGSTGMTAALNFAVPLFSGNGFEGTRNVIDISGDGAESNACLESDAVCAPLQTARDNALAGGIDAINALWIEDEAQPSPRTFFCVDPACTIDPISYGNTNVIGGTGAFQTVVASFDDFAPALLDKLEREVTPVPEPSALLLLGSGLAGLAGWRWRRNRAATS